MHFEWTGNGASMSSCGLSFPSYRKCLRDAHFTSVSYCHWSCGASIAIPATSVVMTKSWSFDNRLKEH
ncbi:hypothetical protein MRB53_003326 [Persea americana]|uniref:Uncharacterized protein n=1 Tax=Persea americana TaxID=3435 RepID=A0ACC2MXC4_PERAE|nr:hypothetical protein MRB53_003326 [Persea americana]